MRKASKLPEDTEEILKRAMKQSKTKGGFQAVQCVWLRYSFGMSSKEIATAIVWHPSSVRRVWAKYLKEGEEGLKRVGRGGRRRQNLTVEQEDKLLSIFIEKAERGGILEVSKIKAAYEKKVGSQVPKSTIYRMLGRHGWRKISPRPRHPETEDASQEEFKKNSR